MLLKMARSSFRPGRGLLDFGAGVDIWSIGVLIYKLGGATFYRGACLKGADVLACYAKQVGTDGWDTYKGASAWTPLPDYPRLPWPKELTRNLGEEATGLLDGMLRMSACERKCVSDCLDHPFIQHLRWPLLKYNGSPIIPGERHAWCAVAGQMPHECQRFVFEEDPALIGGTAANAGLEWSFTQKHSDNKIASHQQHEFDREIIENGHTGTNKVQPALTAMCGFPSRSPSRLTHATAFSRAVLAANAQIFKAMYAEAAAGLKKLPRQCVNTRRFLQTSWDQVFCASQQIHVTDPGDDRRGYLHEMRHKDGAGSACHMGITGYKRRDVCFYVGGAPTRRSSLSLFRISLALCTWVSFRGASTK